MSFKSGFDSRERVAI